MQADGSNAFPLIDRQQHVFPSRDRLLLHTRVGKAPSHSIPSDTDILIYEVAAYIFTPFYYINLYYVTTIVLQDSREAAQLQIDGSGRDQVTNIF